MQSDMKSRIYEEGNPGLRDVPCGSAHANDYLYIYVHGRLIDVSFQHDTMPLNLGLRPYKPY